jgi:hypothetical protein
VETGAGLSNDYDAALDATATTLIDASVGVASRLIDVGQLDNDTLWTVQGEVLWTLLSGVLREVYRSEAGGAGGRDAVQAELTPRVIEQLLDRVYDWPAGSEELRQQQYENFQDWFDFIEVSSGATVRFASEGLALQEMVDSGEIPDDSLAGRLCRRIADKTGEDGRSPLIQALMIETTRTYMTIDLVALSQSLAEVWQASRSR